ncbi:MAG: acyl carrier protein [candidate division Zixibacteria bacterium]|nr:acyl carrier protein [candidate division Zixibacteria bacterium]MDD5426619.1 acyl carrier protein [candidate division Zixibacteria bacterium]
MEPSEIVKKVKDYIEKNFVYDQETKLKNDESLLDTGLVDSTGILEVVSFIEETYDISIQDEEMIPDNLDSIDKIASFIMRKKNKS